jgi:hypothetical protein
MRRSILAHGVAALDAWRAATTTIDTIERPARATFTFRPRLYGESKLDTLIALEYL